MTNAPPRAGIKILSSIGVKEALNELSPQYEQMSGQKLDITFGVAVALKAKIEAGEPFDIAILTDAAIDELIARGEIVPGSRIDVARSGLGLAVRAGAPKPDIRTTDGLVKTLLAARSVATAANGAAGAYFLNVIESLGISEQMKSKIRLDPSGGYAGELAARGETEMAVQLVAELLPVQGIDFVGSFPPEIQKFAVLTLGVSPEANDPLATAGFVDFLTGPKAVAVLNTKGMLPAVTELKSE